MENRIKELRKENSYTQQLLALKIGIDQTTLSRIERGITIPDACLLIRLADAFCVSIDYMLCLSDSKT